MALKTFTGELVRLNAKKVDGRNGPITAYSGKIQKADGEEYEEWVGFGFKKPACKEGDQVVIQAKKENGYWKAVDVEVTEEGAAGEQDEEDSDSGTSGSVAKSASSGRVASSSKGPTTNQAIQYQNSRTAAIQMADLLLKNGAAPISATQGKAGTAKRFEELQALVNKLTVVFYHDLDTFRLVKDIEDVYEGAPKASKPTADFDGDEEEGEGESDDGE